MATPSEDRFQGVPLSELLIEEVAWSEEQAEHIRTRSARKGAPEFDVEPEWATEAVADPDAIVALAPGPSERQPSRSIEVIGWSTSAPARTAEGRGRLLKVWITPVDLIRGIWTGASACEAARQDRREYRRIRA